MNKNIKVIIFDVDGTLYNLKLMRFLILIELLFSLLFFQISLKEILILKKYREERELMSNLSIEGLKNTHFDIISNNLLVDRSKLIKIVIEWIYKRPLKYLPYIKKRKLKALIEKYHEDGFTIFFYSDYPLYQKMMYMKYNFNPNVYWSSLDYEISSFKPNPFFLQYIQMKFNYTKEEILFVGDRLDRDKKIADNFGCNFLHIKYFQKNGYFEVKK